jgi:hypothetical protein
MNRLEKTSIHVEEGGPISRIAASTLGRIGGFQNLMLTGNALKDPSRSLFHKYLPDRFEEHKHDAELIANSSDDNREALKDTVLRLGGTNTIDDIVWKKDRGDNLPWYRRLGGRVLHNQKVSLPMRLIGMPQTLVTNAITPLLRASHYNRMSDTIGEYMHEPAVTQHELGHALDFNSLYGIKPGKGNIASKPLKGLAGDLYHASYFMIPGANLVHEARANSLSDDALKKALGANSKEYKQNAIERTRVLPAGYGSYVGALAGNPLAGIIAGRAYGSVQAAKLQKDFDEEYGNDEAPNVETNNKLKKAASFGRMMGKRAALDPAVANALGLGAVGLAGGGLAGGLLGYENPGDLLDSNSKPQVEFDETGKTPIYNSDGTFKTKKKSRLRAAIEGAMGGGLIGGIGGAAVGGGGTELMRVSPKIQNWLTGAHVKGETKIPIDAVNDLKNNLISGDVNYANSKYDQLGRDKHFDLMRNGIPKDTASQLEVFGKKIGPEIYSGPDWKINLNKGQPTPVDELFSQFGPTVVDNPLSRGANSAVEWVSGLFNKK